ncbi:unnamed protein product [Penicillium manginii]
MVRGKVPVKPRKEKRNLVRWDSDIDAHLLLAIQAACNTSSTKIPWDVVASTMGPKYTEGAIVQHLSKLRGRRVRDGKIVPPPLRRATGGSRKDSKGSVQQGGVAEAIPDEEVDDLSSGGSDPEYGAPTSRKAKRHMTRRASASASVAKRIKTSARKISSESEKVCVNAPFLQFLPASAENPTYVPSDAPESLSEESDDVLSSDKEEMTVPNRFASPAIANIQNSEISEKGSPNPAERQKLRVSFKNRTASMLSSKAVQEQYSSTPVPMGGTSPPTPRPTGDVDRFWSPGPFQMPGDSSQGSTPGRVQDFLRSSSQYPMQLNPLQRPLNHNVKPAGFQVALQSPDFFDPNAYLQRPAFQENMSPRYAQHPTHPQSQGYAQGQQYPQSPAYSQDQSFSPNSFFYPHQAPQSPGMNMPSLGYCVPHSSPDTILVNPQELLVNAGRPSSGGLDELVDFDDNPSAASF